MIKLHDNSTNTLVQTACKFAVMQMTAADITKEIIDRIESKIDPFDVLLNKLSAKKLKRMGINANLKTVSILLI